MKMRFKIGGKVNIVNDFNDTYYLVSYLPKLHKARGFSGAIRTARSIRKLVENGDLVNNKIKCKLKQSYYQELLELK